MGANPLPNWVTAKWEDNDIFKLSKVEIDEWKTRVAAAIGCRWRGFGLQVGQRPYALPVAGTQPISEQVVRDAAKRYLEHMASPPTKDDKTQEQHDKEMNAWRAETRSLSKLSLTVNGCFLNWQSAGTPWNAGYIQSWWSKFESGEKHWDITLDRKAGGPVVTDQMDINSILLTCVGGSSIMALMRAVLGHVARTGACPDELATAFQSIRLTWLFTANEHEIVTMGISDNIEQHNRRRHNEMDNIFQVQSWMRSLQSNNQIQNLDHTKTMDIFKFALALGNPLAPDEVPGWMVSLLQGKIPNLRTKVQALSAKGVTKRWLDDKKAKIEHPEMNTYNKVNLRVRAVLGFYEYEALHEQITGELGRRGLLHRPFPLTSSLLLDPNILTSAAFSGAEKANVPIWRDGNQGRDLQKAMVEVARARLVDFEVLDSWMSGSKALFSSGSAWAAYARLNGPPHKHVDSLVERNFDIPSRWNDSVRSFHTALWLGEYDVEITKLSSLLPASLDTQPSQMQRRISEMFPPLLQILQAKETEASRLAASKEAEEKEAKKRREEEEHNKKQEGDLQSSAVPAVSDGDVTEELFKDQDAAGKRSLCAAFNKDAVKKRDAAMEKAFHGAAAQVLRSRMVVVDSVNSAKSFMESSSKDGLKARMLYLDVAQIQSLQSSGKFSKVLVKQPSQEQQKTFARSILTVPVSPITGSLLIRGAHVRLDVLHGEIADNYPSRYEKSLFIPIDLPTAYARCMKSAAARALGPMSNRNDRSGVEMVFRAVGGSRAGGDDDEEESKKKNPGEGDEEESEEEDDQDDGEQEAEGTEDLPIEALSTKQLKNLFGRDALNMVGAMFQHSSQIGEPARFQPLDKDVQYTKPNGRKAVYRKGQLHPTAVHSAILLALSTNASGITPGECFVQLAGGTPEAAVAAVMAGFTKVVYVAQSEQELNWMRLPSTHEEKVNSIDYSGSNYVSPNPDTPDQGFLAVEAVKMLAPYIKNFVLETPNSLMVPTPVPITIPPLQTFTFIQVTGKVVARTMHSTTTGGESKPAEKAATQPSSSAAGSSSDKTGSGGKGGPGSASGKQVPATPKAKGKIEPEDADDGDEGEDDGEGDDDSGGEAEGMQDELAQLEALETKKETPKKGGKRKGAGGTPSSKKPKRSG